VKKYLALIIIISIILVSCSNNDANEIESSYENVQKQLTDSIEQLEKELERKLSMISELESENEKLKKLLEEKQSDDISQIRVNKEGLYINSDIIYPDELSEEVISDLLGKPNNVKEYEGAHGGFEEVELNYDNFSITSQKQQNKQLVKWLAIKDSSFATQRGITVGSTKNEVIQAYGESFTKDSNVIYYGEKTGISFTLKDDKVKEINIWYMYE
jgi:ribosome-binding ATPase YchF (GTP1/OBG family)